MRVSFQFVLEQAVKGDELANEVIQVIMAAVAQGIETKIYFSFSGNSFTVKPVDN